MLSSATFLSARWKVPRRRCPRWRREAERLLVPHVAGVAAILVRLHPELDALARDGRLTLLRLVDAVLG
jgi:hypothetical protein